ncbi:MAG: tRNA (adenosine(37)-N6)-threonylcarbamoyltransferase complex ATPase subunit type 1 TsaE [Saprospiraceae bacterium]|nr:tRNA (adenosine(37)-N6)-threonylcarbamoyltransferase complex ATPase subunit type 1 TsaE [Saprospiraceae bacterium]
MEIIIKSEAEMKGVAARLLDFAGERRKFALYGSIGAGKTTLVQAVCAQLGITEEVTSPTYALINEYGRQPASDERDEPVYHIDLYRLESLEEALDIGIEDYLEDPFYCLVEWPELIEPLLPPETVRIKIQFIGDSDRKILFL